jgi:hypothetical protein
MRPTLLTFARIVLIGGSITFSRPPTTYAHGGITHSA